MYIARGVSIASLFIALLAGVSICNAHPEPGPRMISGTVTGTESKPAAGIRLVGQCQGDDGSEHDFATQTDGTAQFVVWPLPAGELRCFVTTTGTADGEVPSNREFLVPAGESAIVDLALMSGAPVSVTVTLGGEPAESGNVLYLVEGGGYIAMVDNGRARFSGLPAGGRLFYIGRRADFPDDLRAGCRLIAPQAGAGLDPESSAAVSIGIDASTLRDVRVSQSESPWPVVMYLADAPRAGLIEGVATASGSNVVFPCLGRNVYEIALRIDGDLKPVQTVDLTEGDGLLELQL